MIPDRTESAHFFRLMDSATKSPYNLRYAPSLRGIGITGVSCGLGLIAVSPNPTMGVAGMGHAMTGQEVRLPCIALM